MKKIILYSLLVSVFTLSIARSEEHTSELQSRLHLVCRLLLEKKIIYNLAVFTVGRIEIARRITLRRTLQNPPQGHRPARASCPPRPIHPSTARQSPADSRTMI